MEDILAFEDRFYILASSSLVDQRTLVIKKDDTFGVFNTAGDIEPIAGKAQGVFTDGMRFLSRLETRLNERRPLLLSSNVSSDGSHIIVDMTNPDITGPDLPLPHGSIHLWRSKSASPGGLQERIRLGNFGDRPVRAVLAFNFDADFADIFEVRGTPRGRRGNRLEPEVSAGRAVRLGYQGLDGISRFSTIEFDPPPRSLTATSARYEVNLRPGERVQLRVNLRCSPPHASGPLGPAPDDEARFEVRPPSAEYCRISSSNERLVAWIDRSLADVRILLTPTLAGEFPYAGIPWYSTPFGRDGIITALQLLWVNPSIARGVLGFLAYHQASRYDALRDAEPGKILHEFRENEMANIGEVPFGRYYGSIDSTPLFVMLAGAYHEATGDTDFIRALWPSIERALTWIDRDGDIDGDGFVEYARKTPEGLVNQGWKDSHDALFHADGSMAPAPIALCEVQGYVYAARRAAASMARMLGESGRADDIEQQAAVLRSRFHRAFWLDDMGTYALALDGQKRPCRVLTSNPAHCLWTGIVPEDSAPLLAHSLTSREMYSGWGIRTVASGEARYNPMSYHNGSVWPHDNAIAAAGFARYGLRDEVLRLFNSWMAVSDFLDLSRLPELFCGFRRQSGSGPTQYPVACSPQAWASGSALMFLAACMGLSIDGPRSTVIFRRPALPRGVQWITLTGLHVGQGQVDLLLHREGDDVGVFVQRRAGHVSVQVQK